jgi:hypothetical protein
MLVEGQEVMKALAILFTSKYSSQNKIWDRTYVYTAFKPRGVPNTLATVNTPCQQKRTRADEG